MIFSPIVGKIGPFVGMTYDFWPSCGNRHICGNMPSCESNIFTTIHAITCARS